MARTFRFYEKKRGHRRTGPKAFGAASEALFFGVFFVLGCLGLAFFFSSLVVPEWRANYEFVKHACVVLDTRISREQSEDQEPQYRPEIQIEYALGEQTHVVWTYDVWTHEAEGGFSQEKEKAEEIADQFTVGKSYVCWYDPEQPDRAILIRGYRWWTWPTFLIPISFLVIGGVGLVHALFSWGKSAERRAALASRASKLRVFDVAAKARSAYPGVPPETNITNSPGTTLAYRLPVAAESSWRLAGTLTACCLWNGAVLVLLTVVTRGYVQGKPDWLMTIFVLPFAAVGIGLAFYFLRQLFVATAISPTLIEIADHPLLPGRGYRLFVSQSGRLRMNSLKISLVCEEEATFRHGTDARTEVHTACEIVLFEQQAFEIEKGVPFELECELRLPDRAMHSFRANQNEVRWKIVVDGDTEARPSFQRKFPVIVHPQSRKAGPS